MKGFFLALALATLTACDGRAGAATAAGITGGDYHLGRQALREYGCGACHAIPGVTGARGLVGPPLGGIASRSYIAGVLSNSPENMIRWILDPPSVNPLTAMPNVGVSERRARDMAAYLYTLR
jgi:cytochrome c